MPTFGREDTERIKGHSNSHSTVFQRWSGITIGRTIGWKYKVMVTQATLELPQPRLQDGGKCSDGKHLTSSMIMVKC